MFYSGVQAHYLEAQSLSSSTLEKLLDFRNEQVDLAQRIDKVAQLRQGLKIPPGNELIGAMEVIGRLSDNTRLETL